MPTTTQLVGGQAQTGPTLDSKAHNGSHCTAGPAWVGTSQRSQRGASHSGSRVGGRAREEGGPQSGVWGARLRVASQQEAPVRSLRRTVGSLGPTPHHVSLTPGWPPAEPSPERPPHLRADIPGWTARTVNKRTLVGPSAKPWIRGEIPQLLPPVVVHSLTTSGSVRGSIRQPQSQSAFSPASPITAPALCTGGRRREGALPPSPRSGQHGSLLSPGCSWQTEQGGGQPGSGEAEKPGPLEPSLISRLAGLGAGGLAWP